ncbi:flotillin-like protein FloA [Adhaeretor mobilis]|uniref:Flotillin-like protein FloA n=1 Tax=Adhaeretor mobilis TaxID=1930276 RepID=A0A517MRW6_9BACT|nr:flotillin-like protein FloA [Adhaeretor mobilis]QDS97628.1 SigmaW regulon antibacterial [Adhaeretor mobilis]
MHEQIALLPIAPPQLAQLFEDNASTVWLIAAFAVLIGFLVFVAIAARFARLWIQSVSTGAGIGIFDLIRMTFRKVNPTVIVRSKIMAVQAGLDDHDDEITTKALEAHYLAGGNVPLVIRSIIAARKAKIIELGFRQATAIDLAGRNILEAVQTSVYPRVIDCPSRESKRPSLDAIAKDGIQLKVRARVTVRANLNQLIGGATEETIIARVGEGIVSAIGSAPTHAHVLENPDSISKAVLARRLDSQTAFEIVSIDIADIDVGDNIGARLQADQAEADTRVARAKAEGKRAMAVSQEQENFAAMVENKAKLVAAEAEVPKAMAEAFGTGNLGILDYYKLKNVQADTDMRDAIATGGTGRK